MRDQQLAQLHKDKAQLIRGRLVAQAYFLDCAHLVAKAAEVPDRKRPVGIDREPREQVLQGRLRGQHADKRNR